MVNDRYSDRGWYSIACQWRHGLKILLLAEVTALLLVLAPGVTTANWLAHGLAVSAFVQAVTWIVVGLLCLLRGYVNQLRPGYAYGVGLVCVAAVTSLGSVIVLAWPFGPSTAGAVANELGFVLRNLAVAMLVALLAGYLLAVYQRARQPLKTAAQMRIEALQARIRPHFLFNSMNTIASLTRSSPQCAEQAVEDLADLFRVALAQQDHVKLANELDITRRYLNIESLRLGQRLTVDWREDPEVPLAIEVPALILQPLVENAIYHGIEPATGGGTVAVEVRCENAGVAIAVTNPLPAAKRLGSKRGSQIAQDNVRERLTLAYGDTDPLKISQTQAHYRVEFTIRWRNTGT